MFLKLFSEIKLKMLYILLLGTASGLPRALTASTLTAMLSDKNIPLQSISAFSIIAFPYSFKFLWSPIIDSIKIPIISRLLGRKFSWLLLSQAILFFAVTIMSVAAGSEINIADTEDFDSKIKTLMLICALLSFSSATQDIIVDSIRVNIVNIEQQGNASSFAVLGYRFGMLISGAGCLTLAQQVSWEAAYSFMGTIIAVLFAANFLFFFIVKEIRSHNIDGAEVRSKNVRSKIAKKAKNKMLSLASKFFIAYVKPLKSLYFFGPVVINVILIVLFKVADASIGFLTTPFLLHLGFSKIEIAEIVKLYGFMATIFGSFVAGYILSKIKLRKSLVVAALVVQSVSNLAFYFQNIMGYNKLALIVTISFENFFSGFSTCILVVYLSAMCIKRYSATQYAILSSITTVPLLSMSYYSGRIVELYGWNLLFVSSCIIGLVVAILPFFAIKGNIIDKDKS